MRIVTSASELERRGPDVLARFHEVMRTRLDDEAHQLDNIQCDISFSEARYIGIPCDSSTTLWSSLDCEDDTRIGDSDE